MSAADWVTVSGYKDDRLVKHLNIDCLQLFRNGVFIDVSDVDKIHVKLYLTPEDMDTSDTDDTSYTSSGSSTEGEEHVVVGGDGNK
jgi:hypothetical protein